jgi:hypothetical protein
MRTPAALGLVALLSLTVALDARAESPFAQGRLQLGLGLGSTFAYDSRYIVAAARFGVFAIDGLLIGAEANAWIGGSPFVASVSPEVRYVLHFLDPLNPYLGVFYRHWFVGGGHLDQDNLGGRLGAIWILSDLLYLTIGGAYERRVSASPCTDDAATCATLYPDYALYPELALTVSL